MRAAPLVAAGIGAVLLSGCGGSGAADAGKTLPPIATTTTAVSPTTTVTHLTRKQELKAAEATVRAYFAAVNALPRDMNAGPLERLMTDDCGCQAQVRSVRYFAKRQEHFTQTAKLEALKSVYDSPSLVEVLVRYSATGGGVARTDGHLASRTRALRHQQNDFFIIRSNDRWLIHRIEIVK